MKLVHGLSIAAAVVITVVASAEAGELKLSIADGKVTLICENVTARQILAEWARVGQTKIVNAEKLTGPPLTLRLEGVSEKQALDVLLRSASGFLIAERPTLVSTLSLYDRILIMPTSTPVATTASTPGSRVPTTSTTPAPPAFTPTPTPDPEPAEDTDVAAPAMPSPDVRPPETNFDYANPQEFLRRRQEMLQQQGQPGPPATFPGTVLPTQLPGGNPVTTPAGLPTAPAGSSRPGEIVKPPQQPPATYANPYGLPYNVQPGSAATGPGMEPDRAKYANPYQPTRPPQDPKNE
jgi:hypothetical protein